MRDPKRIKQFCIRLSKAWELHPDWRFGQLICNVFSQFDFDPFFPEDDMMILLIEKALGVEQKDEKKETEDERIEKLYGEKTVMTTEKTDTKPAIKKEDTK